MKSLGDTSPVPGTLSPLRRPGANLRSTFLIVLASWLVGPAVLAQVPAAEEPVDPPAESGDHGELGEESTATGPDEDEALPDPPEAAAGELGQADGEATQSAPEGIEESTALPRATTASEEVQPEDFPRSPADEEPDGLAPTPPRGLAPPAPLRIDLNDAGTQYVRFLTWHQVWLRHTETNPGTLVDGDGQRDVFDAGLRRSRFLVFGAPIPEALLVFHFGINNQTFNGERKPQVFVHDAWGQVDLVGNALTIGAGLHYWNGVSRLTNASTINQLPMDAPILNWPTIDRTDQFGRHLGFFAKGQLAGLDYRIAVNRNFSVDRELTAGGPSDYATGGPGIALAGYFQWQFLEPESNLLPYLTGTYLGAKRVFNLGAGFHWSPDALASLSTTGRERRHDLVALGVDAFLDTPIGDGAVTAYAGYNYLDFGPNHVRNIGIMNVGSGGASFGGAGNAYPVMGTGHHLIVQLGYLLPWRPLGTQLQPYATTQVSFMDGLGDLSPVIEGGLNWFAVGHYLKWTLHYRARPLFEASEPARPQRTGFASEVVVQLQVFL